MKMPQSLLFATLAVLSLGVPPTYADTDMPGASDSEMDRCYGAMQERYRLMQEQMSKIRQTKDPVERQKLMQEYWQTQQGAGMMDHGYGGMGPGMMGGYGMGPGMMGGGYGGMGAGMMGGYGMGPGMMGGYGMGPQVSDLSAEQQARIAKIQDETRKKHWQWMGMMMDEQAKLRDLYNMPKRDSAAIGKAYEKIGELQRQMFESSMDAHKRMEAVLTKEQLEKSRRSWHRGGYPGD